MELTFCGQGLDQRLISTVAEIGAGHGQMTLAAAKRVGKIYSTELEGMLTNVQQLAAIEKNIAAVKPAETETNLDDWPNHDYRLVFKTLPDE